MIKALSAHQLVADLPRAARNYARLRGLDLQEEPNRLLLSGPTMQTVSIRH